MRQGVTLARSSGRKQERAHAGRLANTDSRDGSLQVLHGIVDCQTGQPVSQLSSDTERDFFMGSEAAKEYGIIDDIVSRKD